VEKLIEVNKSEAMDGKYLYINLSGFRDKVDRQVIFEKIQQIIRDSNTKVRVF